jgi:RNA polymerase sigma-70 factor (ECF subfamily)
MLASGISEADAIERAQQGDAQCFELLYGLHKRRVYSLCLRMVGNVELAEDLTQEAFLQLFRKIASFRGDSAFSTWLHRLTANIVLMHVRKKVLPETSLDETFEPNEESPLSKEIVSQDGVLAGAIDRLVLDRAIADLSPGYRLVFLLHDVEGYEHTEISELLGCSAGTSKSQLHKARTRLRTALSVTCAEQCRRKSLPKPKPRPEVSAANASAAAA